MPIHRTSSHNLENCRDKRRNGHTDLNKNNESNFFIDASHEGQITSLKFDAEIEDKAIEVVFDTGSNLNFVREELLSNSSIYAIETPFTIVTANGKEQRVTRKASFKICLLQIPKTKFDVVAYLMPGLPTNLNLGLRFFEKYGITLYFTKKLMKIAESEIEIPVFPKDKIPEPDKLLTEKVFLTNYKEKFNEILEKYKKKLRMKFTD